MLRVGIVGCGGICNDAHVPAYHKIENAQVIAICDINPDKFSKTTERLGKKVNTYVDYKEMIEKENLDFVDICTPNYLHAEIAVYAMEHGLNAFSEKPDTITVANALEMKRVQEQTGKQLMIMRNNRHLFSSRELKGRIQNGEFGEIYAARCGWIRKRGIPGKGGWFTTKAMSGGGPLIDLGVHIIDLTMYLMGNPRPVSVSGCTFTKFASDQEASDSVHASFGEKVEGGTFDVEDLAMGFIKFDNGACLQIEFSWASNIKNEKTFIELRGEKKGAEWLGNFYRVFDGNSYQPVKAYFSMQKQLRHIRNGHTENLRHFCNVLEKGEKPDFTIDQGINMIKILTAMYESAQSGREVLL